VVAGLVLHRGGAEARGDQVRGGDVADRTRRFGHRGGNAGIAFGADAEEALTAFDGSVYNGYSGQALSRP
jgi:hypothetical protein